MSTFLQLRREDLHDLVVRAALEWGAPPDTAEALGVSIISALRPAQATDWPESPDLLGPPEPEPLPLDALPPVLRAHVESVGGATQTPTDLPGVLAISAISITVQGKCEVRVRPGWTEPVNLYAAAVLPPASRKSPVFRHILSRLEDWEREKAREEAPRRQAAEDRREVLEKRLEAAKRDAAKGDVPLEAVEAARLELLDAQVPPVTRLNAPEASPEALVQLMAEQGGRIAVVAPEGDPLRIADGRYSGHGDARLDALKRAWTGREPIRVDRVGREGEYVPRPALTLALCLQPSVLETLRNSRSMRGEGVFGRILWVAPDPRLGSRLTGPDVPPLDEDAAAAWGALLRHLLDARPREVEDDGSYVPHVLRLDDDALEVLHAWEAEVEEDLGPGGALSSIPDWGGKLVGQTVRLAALLDVARRAEERRPLWAPLSRWAVEGAVRLGRALRTHALSVFGELEMDGRTSDLRYLLRRLRELPEGATESDLRRAVQGRKSIGGAEDVEELVDELEARGCIRRIHAATEGPGRPPSPVLELHPELRSDPPVGVAENAENTVEGAGEPLSRNIRNPDPGGEPEPPDPLEQPRGEASPGEEDGCPRCGGYLRHDAGPDDRCRLCERELEAAEVAS